MITINLRQPHLTPIISKPFCNIAANLVYSSQGNEVDNVIIAGNPIMIDGKFLTIDEDSIVKEANERAQQLFKSAAEDWFKTGSKIVDYNKQGWI